MNVHGQWYSLPWPTFAGQSPNPLGPGPMGVVPTAAAAAAPLMSAAINSSPATAIPQAAAPHQQHAAPPSLSGQQHGTAATAAYAPMPAAPNGSLSATAYQANKLFFNGFGTAPPPPPQPAPPPPQTQQQTTQAQQQQAVAAAVASMTAAGAGVQPNTTAFLNPYAAAQGLLTTPQSIHPLLTSPQFASSQFNLNQQHQQAAVAAQAAVLQAAAQQIQQQQQQLHPVSIANGLFAQSHVTSMPIQTKVPLLRTPRMITKVGNVNPISIATI